MREAKQISGLPSPCPLPDGGDARAGRLSGSGLCGRQIVGIGFRFGGSCAVRKRGTEWRSSAQAMATSSVSKSDSPAGASEAVSPSAARSGAQARVRTPAPILGAGLADFHRISCGLKIRANSHSPNDEPPGRTQANDCGQGGMIEHATLCSQSRCATRLRPPRCSSFSSGWRDCLPHG